MSKLTRYYIMQTKAEKEKHLEMIKEGQLNIIVGTHSLLGDRVVYSNLGLLVVDEEQVLFFLASHLNLVLTILISVESNFLFLLPSQRFGVKQKEKIASFKTSVDVLTLSATPIPRTLYLALTGFRDAR